MYDLYVVVPDGKDILLDSQIEKVQDQYFFKYGDKYFYLFEVSSYLFNPINTENPLIESLPYIRYANGKEID